MCILHRLDSSQLWSSAPASENTSRSDAKCCYEKQMEGNVPASWHQLAGPAQLPHLIMLCLRPFWGRRRLLCSMPGAPPLLLHSNVLLPDWHAKAGCAMEHCVVLLNLSPHELDDLSARVGLHKPYVAYCWGKPTTGL